jgi:hypothetical protein
MPPVNISKLIKVLKDDEIVKTLTSQTEYPQEDLAPPWPHCSNEKLSEKLYKKMMFLLGKLENSFEFFSAALEYLSVSHLLHLFQFGEAQYNTGDEVLTSGG